MKFVRNRKIILFIGIFVFLLVGILLTGGIKDDVYLKDFELSSDGMLMEFKVGISSSSGYVRKMKRSSGSTNYYLTFYSTYGINSKLGARDSFTIDIDNNVDEIYFYSGDKGYRKVLEKDSFVNWVKVTNDTDVKNIVDKTKEIKDFGCAEALEEFYEDDKYVYFFNCIKGEYIVVVYNDNSEELVSEALRNGEIKISDLDSYGIEYIREKKVIK